MTALLTTFRLPWYRRPFLTISGALLEFDGEYGVVTNVREGRARQRFSAAHELGHYLMHRRFARAFLCRRDENGELDKAANIFARELLMPVETVLWLYRRGVSSPEALGRILGVSARAASYRLRELSSELLWTERDLDQGYVS